MKIKADVFIIIGSKIVKLLKQLGEATLMLVDTIWCMFTSPPRRDIIITQMKEIGVMSLPVVLLTGMFTGMVLAVQSYYQLYQLSMETSIGILVGLSMTNELGPVLTGLMVAGRVGASMAAELGTMKVTEQIDALETLATSPIKYLVVPRFIACVLLVPILTVYSIFIGIVGGYIIGVKLMGINATFFIKNMLDYTDNFDLANGIIKAFFFAIIVAITGCYKGFSASGGAEGVGKVTTQAVVVACISILISDFFLSIILF
ncbi:MAG: ABC transporter permease [Candidatus Aureabacteria bacterium]|nr:ABC transporter permease [Candidatus Auribacterota bacterium]